MGESVRTAELPGTRRVGESVRAAELYIKSTRLGGRGRGSCPRGLRPGRGGDGRARGRAASSSGGSRGGARSPPRGHASTNYGTPSASGEAAEPPGEASESSSGAPILLRVHRYGCRFPNYGRIFHDHGCNFRNYGCHLYVQAAEAPDEAWKSSPGLQKSSSGTYKTALKLSPPPLELQTDVCKNYYPRTRARGIRARTRNPEGCGGNQGPLGGGAALHWKTQWKTTDEAQVSSSAHCTLARLVTVIMLDTQN